MVLPGGSGAVGIPFKTAKCPAASAGGGEAVIKWDVSCWPFKCGVETFDPLPLLPGVPVVAARTKCG